MNTIRNAKTIQNKSRMNEVHPIGENVFEVVSGASGNVYQVRCSETGCICNCTWATHRPEDDPRSGCSHVLAVMNFIAREGGAVSVSAWTSEADAQRQHRRTMDIGDGVLVTVRAAA
jgi:hypothetical protein